MSAVQILADVTPAYWQSTLVRVLVLGIVVPTGAAITAIAFLFKVMAWMQSRTGPMEAGLLKKTKVIDGKRTTVHTGRGELQLVAEVGKWLQKEDLVPEGADRFAFKAAPFVVLGSTFLFFAAIPAGPGPAVAALLPGGVFFILAVSALSVIGVLLAGWGSNSKYAFMGGVRAAGQLIAYELPMVLAVVGVVILTGSFNLNDIVQAQVDFKLFDAIPLPFIVLQLPLFLVFLTATQAELNQPPFDMPVAESELVTGYQVEYSGFRFLTFFLAEFATAFGFAALVATLFLGGWYIPIGIDSSSAIWYVLGPIVLLVKILAVSFVIFWIRFTYPRFREDQLQKLAWKYLIPISLVWIAVTAVAVVVVR